MTTEERVEQLNSEIVPLELKEKELLTDEERLVVMNALAELRAELASLVQ